MNESKSDIANSSFQHGRRVLRNERTLLWLSIGIFIYCAIRAHIQSITIDEADTYLAWAWKYDEDCRAVYDRLAYL